MKKLCAFDLDGTLVDTLKDIGNAVNYALNEMGREPYPISAYNKMVGNGMEKLCRRAMRDGTEEEIKELISKYHNYYLNHCCVESLPYEGVRELLAKIKGRGCYIGIITNKPQSQANEVVATLFGENVFDEVIGQSPRFEKKPSSEAMEYFMDKFKVSAEEVVYIGDSDVDMEFGKNSGVDTIGVSWGFRGREELVNAGGKYVVDTCREIEEILGL